MRILVISDLPQFVVGGAEMQALRLIEAWLQAGHEVRCFGRRARTGVLDLPAGKLPVYRIATWQGPGRWLRGLSYFVSLCVLLLRYRRWPDVIYTRFLGDAAATVSLLKAARLLRCALIATPANSGPDGDAAYLRSIPGHDWLVRRMARHCDAINLIAPGMAEHFTELGFDPGRYSRIPNGVPMTETEHRETNSAGPRLSLLSVGRLSPQKAYDVLLDALAQLSGTHDFELVVLGEGPERAALEAQTQRLGLADRIHWRGTGDPAQVKAALRNADLFVLSSRYEGMSNAALEAMEAGLPLVLTACGGIDTYVDADMGWIVPPGDTAALAAALSKAMCLSAEERAAMGGRCRRRALDLFSMPAIAKRYVALFDEVRQRERGGKGATHA